MTIDVVTYNIHKGLSHFNRRMIIHELRERLRGMNPDILLLQEVQGDHTHNAERFRDWPAKPQYEFIADATWSDVVYGQNAVYDHGHHGNAILSRYKVLRAANQDISYHPFESRGLLHCEIAIPDAP